MGVSQRLVGFYATQGVISTPGRYGELFDSLPNTVAEIVGVIQGLLLHAYWVGHYGVNLTPAQEEHIQARHIEKILETVVSVDNSLLAVARPYEKRFFGTCRDFSLFLTSVLRHKGIPARCRCGFGKYFTPGLYEDHWIVEYWHEGEGQWVAVDPQLDELQRRKLNTSFDPLRLPQGQFVCGAEAWKLWRAGKEEANKFGISDFRGFLFVQGNLVRELAALNKVELLPWDGWGLAERVEPDTADFPLLDEVADLILADSEELLAVYESNDALRVAEQITSYRG